ncbi:UNKNOWN [Stylonychia lemnae]|uniref:Uncharacterized protein n=1 Tax=Stylonychia lemnae TaxID=5949 RepID=A0A078B087_STYLE|nr:UNKNOWN [Stylonychia lemnae]|eukprot:CDW87904.1 UNKNOWN [Stylonychia lemnae]
MQECKPVDGFMPRDEFQKSIQLELFNQNIHIVYNEVFAVATLGQKRQEYTVQNLTTRYIFAQFWCEFTKEVLTEFLEEDLAYKYKEVQFFIRKATKMVKKSDMGIYEQPYKKKPHQQNNSQSREELQNGLEFFFSNVMMKCYQVPVLFTQSSEEQTNNDQIGTFVVMFFEKSVRKRTYAKTTTQKQRLRKTQDSRKNFDSSKGRILEDSLFHRESKMRRFCNYFVTLFHQKKLNPFSQFVNGQTLKLIKQRVRDKMNQFTEDEPYDQDGAGDQQTVRESQKDILTSSSRGRKQAAEVQKPTATMQKQSIIDNNTQESVIINQNNKKQHKMRKPYKNSMNTSMSNKDQNDHVMSASPYSKDKALPYNKNRNTSNRQSVQLVAGMNQQIDSLVQDNPLYQANKRNQLVKSSLAGMTEQKSLEEGNHQEERKEKKSKSVLSRYLGSKHDKYSIDFDDIQPAKLNGVMNNFNSKNNSRQGFYDYTDAALKEAKNPISRIESYESDEINEIEKDPKLVKTYAGKKDKSRQAKFKQQDSTKFQTAQFGQVTFSPKTTIQPPTLGSEDVQPVEIGKPRYMKENHQKSNQPARSNIQSKGAFEIVSERSEIARNPRESINHQVNQEYYKLQEMNNNADSMLSLYNKIPDSKNIQFYSSDVSLESKIHDKKQTKASNIRTKNKTNWGNAERVNRDINLNSSRSNPYQDNNHQQIHNIKGGHHRRQTNAFQDTPGVYGDNESEYEDASEIGP